jgi:divalent metal cation (Fe/Co/Zn/Cd) transporter
MAPAWAFGTARWPYGHGRPGLATAAGVLGYVTAGLTIVVSLVFLLVLLSGNGDTVQAVLVLGLPCAAGLIIGASQLLRRRSAQILFASAAASVTVLVLSLIVGVGFLTQNDLLGQAVFLALALPLPLLTAIFARARAVTGWLGAR